MDPLHSSPCWLADLAFFLFKKLSWANLPEVEPNTPRWVMEEKTKFKRKKQRNKERRNEIQEAQHPNEKIPERMIWENEIEGKI